MSLLKLKTKLKNLKGTSSIEFLAVFVFLFFFFVLILDIALFFRQVYLVQTIADETIARLTVEKQCSKDLPSTIIIANKATSFYYADLQFSASSQNHKIVKLKTDGDKYSFLIQCRNEITPDSLIFTLKYKGVFLYRTGKVITSNISVNTTYY